MAIQNQVILNGRIRKVKKVKRDDKLVRYTIALHVIRRPNAPVGNIKGDIREDIINVSVTDPELIKYLEEKKVTEGDFMEVSGTYNTIHGTKSYICEHCGEKNSYDGTVTFVRPLCIRVEEANPKRVEMIYLTELERRLPKEDVIKLIYARKTIPGRIINLKDMKTDENNMYRIRIMAQEEITEEEEREWLYRMGEISNRVYVMGNVCNEPHYNPIDNKGGRMCMYQIGINRKVYVKEDDPDARADFPWIRSLGEQAEKDYEALKVGSLIFVDGSIQAREGFHMTKICEHCGGENKVRGEAMEIVPYAVEYLRNCTINKESEDDEAMETLSELREPLTDEEEFIWNNNDGSGYGMDYSTYSKFSKDFDEYEREFEDEE